MTQWKLNYYVQTHAERFRALWASDRSTVSIAAELEVALAFVYKLARELGLKARSPGAPKGPRKSHAPRRNLFAERHPGMHEQILALRAEGLSHNQIATRLALSIWTVRQRLAKVGQSGSLYLKDEVRDAFIAAQREAGVSLEEIGQALGISRERVRQLIAKMGRKDLQGPRLGRPRKILQVECICRYCGKKELKIPSAAKAHRYCSTECRGHGQRYSGSVTAEMADEIVRLRMANLSWQTIATKMSRNTMTVWRHGIIRAELTGQAIPAFIPRQQKIS